MVTLLFPSGKFQYAKKRTKSWRYISTVRVNVSCQHYIEIVIISGEPAKQCHGRISTSIDKRVSSSKSRIWIKQPRVVPQPIQPCIKPKGPRPINKRPLKHISFKVMMMATKRRILSSRKVILTTKTRRRRSPSTDMRAVCITGFRCACPSRIRVSAWTRSDITIFIQGTGEGKSPGTVHPVIGVGLVTLDHFVESICFLDSSPLVTVSWDVWVRYAVEILTQLRPTGQSLLSRSR